MMGTNDKPRCHAKAAESGLLLRWSLWLVRKYGTVLPNSADLIASGEALVEYLNITRMERGNLTLHRRQQLTDTCITYLQRREAAGVTFLPKTNLMIHLCVDAGEFGNPIDTGCWVDESLNQELRGIAADAHALVWRRRVLSTLSHERGPVASRFSR